MIMSSCGVLDRVVEVVLQRTRVGRLRDEVWYDC